MQTVPSRLFITRSGFSRASHLLIAAILLGSSVSAPAADDTALESCAKIEDLSKRLGCYDALSASKQPAPPAAPAVAAPAPAPPPAAPAAAPAPAETPPAAAIPATPPPVAAPTAPPAKPVSADEMAFGSEALPRPPGTPAVLPDPNIEQIRTRIAGEFTGWERGSLIKLENGQVWKCLGFNSLKYTATSPIVTIERGVMATYILQIEGISKKATVRRVQ